MSTKAQIIEAIYEIDAEYELTGKETKAELEAILVEMTEDEPKTMSKTLLKYRNGYEPTTAYSGRKSLNNGDEIADFLAGREPDEILIAAERILGLDAGFLTEKYTGLNPGQKRMNGGNRLRAAMKRGDITAADLH